MSFLELKSDVLDQDIMGIGIPAKHHSAGQPQRPPKRWLSCQAGTMLASRTETSAGSRNSIAT